MLAMIEVSTKEPPISGAHSYPYWRANSPLFLPEIRRQPLFIFIVDYKLQS